MTVESTEWAWWTAKAPGALCLHLLNYVAEIRNHVQVLSPWITKSSVSVLLRATFPIISKQPRALLMCT